MNLKSIEKFSSAYRQYRREKNSPVGGLVALVGLAGVVSAVIGGYVVERTGNDANAYNLMGLMLMIPALVWLVADMHRFAKLRTK